MKLSDRVRELERAVANLRGIAPRPYKQRVRRQRADGEPVGAPMLIAKWMAENPKLSATEIEERLRGEGRVGIKRGTVTAIRYHALNVMRELQALGHLPADFL